MSTLISMTRLGLCCVFFCEPIRFRQATAAVMGRRFPSARREALGEIALRNAVSLRTALEYCVGHGIGALQYRDDDSLKATRMLWLYAEENVPSK